ncbi:secreted protein [Beggiatoa sp. SS]|nr:secreted protein [Beggiatoa sp. SS]
MKLKLLSGAVLSTSLIVGANVTQATSLTDGLVAYYPFEGNAQDAGGMGHHGTGNVTFVAGKVGQAANFKGKNTVITATLPQVKKTYSVSLFAQLNSNNRVESQ